MYKCSQQINFEKQFILKLIHLLKITIFHTLKKIRYKKTNYKENLFKNKCYFYCTVTYTNIEVSLSVNHTIITHLHLEQE